MVIEVNKNIDNYKESVVMGLSARQLLYSVLSVIAGGGIVLLLYKQVGLTVSTYIAIPVVAPIAMTGFYSYNGMTFMEMMRLKLHFAFGNRPLTYVSTEGEQVIRRLRQEEMQDGQKKQKKKPGGRQDTDRAGFEKAKRNMISMMILTIIFVAALAGFAVWYKYR